MASPYLFKNTTIQGKIHQTIDWDSLEKLLPKKTTIVGAPSWLPSRGFFALMFLKHYTGLSDEKLLEDFHTNWAMQVFCGVLLTDNERIKDNSFVSRVRSYLGEHLDLNLFQSMMINSWKTEIPDKNVLLMDATCYEVYIRTPTDSDRRCGKATLGSLYLALGKTNSSIMHQQKNQITEV
ncbi:MULTISPECIES: transposase [unclassified Arcicella]|uniref:transposase n=1 Tax=unclassified Arcicella TaxID=2644986 RepID=UPI00286245A4|nr:MULTISPECIES: transposase [unclassified Arcicella]MDR6560587.1 hypothetical protein [Arcicella sp. BE51]MDR6814670.1 hypothetical protein [Arcicella sp. BE140]MDR6826116.1 hypothetical protein [Arcicella sp. BE139]